MAVGLPPPPVGPLESSKISSQKNQQTWGSYVMLMFRAKFEQKITNYQVPISSVLSHTVKYEAQIDL